MYMLKKCGFSFVLLTICMLAFFSFMNHFLIERETIYVHQMEKDTLLNKIERYAEQYNEDPEDAYIDRIWKKTPGRQGRKVNIEKSYEKMKPIKRFDESLIVYETIKPDVHLTDLPPAPIYRGHPKKKLSRS